MDYAGYARLLGLTGIRVDDPDRVEAAWDQAFAADRPVVLDVLTDKNVPPLPAHVTFEQAKGVASALLHRDPDTSSAPNPAPHPMAKKLSVNGIPGIFNAPVCLAVYAKVFEEEGALDSSRPSPR